MGNSRATTAGTAALRTAVGMIIATALLLPTRAEQWNADTWMEQETLPWSEPVLVRNNDGTSQMAVFDRNYPAGLNVRAFRQPGLLSGWLQTSIDLYLYSTKQHCVIVVVAPICKQWHRSFPVGKASLSINGRVFQLSGLNGRFSVTDDLRSALASAGDSEVLVRFSSMSGSDTATSRIGPATVNAWRQIYGHQPAAASGPSRPDDGGRVDDLDLANWRYRDHLPWSKSIRVDDPFEGSMEIVLDRDYRINAWTGAEQGLVSRWSATSIWIHVYQITASNGFTGNQMRTYTTFPLDGIRLSLGPTQLSSKPDQLDRSENRIRVDAELAAFLAQASAGQDPRPVTVTVELPGGKTDSFLIGSGTVKAWGPIYGQPTESRGNGRPKASGAMPSRRASTSPAASE